MSSETTSVAGSLVPGAIPAEAATNTSPSSSSPSSSGAILNADVIAAVVASSISASSSSALVKLTVSGSPAAASVSVSTKSCAAVSLQDAPASVSSSLTFSKHSQVLSAEKLLSPTSQTNNNPDSVVFPVFETVSMDVPSAGTILFALVAQQDGVELAWAQLPLAGLTEKAEIEHLPLSSPEGGKIVGHLTVALSRVAFSVDSRPLSLLFGTWNVGNAPPASDAFEKWLGDGKEDLVVVGLQEATWGDKKEGEDQVASPTTSSTPTSKPGKDAVLALLAGYLAPKGYTELMHRVLGQMKLAAFIKSGVKDVVLVGHEGEATGLVGIWPNKGTIVLALTVSGYPITFLSSHMAAHEGHVADRRADFRESVRGLSSKLGFDFLHESGAVWWAGDLNYRLEYGQAKNEFKEPPKEEKKGIRGLFSRLGSRKEPQHSDPPTSAISDRERKLVRSETFPTNPEKRQDEPDEDADPDADLTLWSSITHTVDTTLSSNPFPTPSSEPLTSDSPYASLLSKDELAKDREAGRSFALFQEQPIHFPPTFKRTRSTLPPMYEKKRLPAWCDRVMWTSMPGIVEPRGYWSGENVGSSDHKPVAARFAVKIPILERVEEGEGAMEARRAIGGFGPLGNFSGVKVGEFGSRTGSFSSAASSSTGKLSLGSTMMSEKGLVGGVERWGLKIVELKAHEIAAKDVGGTSDPYAIFTGFPLLNASNTGTIMRTLNPVWSPSDLPTLRLRQTVSSHPTVNDLARSLKDEWLTIAIMDWDRGTRDDLCGRGVIPLDGLAESWKFEVPLRLVGELQGWVEGRAEVVKIVD